MFIVDRHYGENYCSNAFLNVGNGKISFFRIEAAYLLFLRVKRLEEVELIKVDLVVGFTAAPYLNYCMWRICTSRPLVLYTTSRLAGRPNGAKLM